MGYYEYNYKNKKRYSGEDRTAYEELNSKRNQPNKTKKFQELERSFMYRKSDVFCPIFNINPNMDPEQYGVIYDFTINNYSLLEDIIYRYFTLDPTCMSKDILYLDMGEFVDPTRSSLENYKNKIRENRRTVYNSDTELRAYIIANNIRYLATKAYTKGPTANPKFNGDIINYGYLFVYYTHDTVANRILEDPYLYCSEISKKFHELFFYYDIGISFMYDYTQYYKGNPIFYIFMTSRQYKKNNSIIARSLTDVQVRLNVYNSIKNIIKQGINIAKLTKERNK